MTPARSPVARWTAFALVALVAVVASWLVVRSTLQGLLGAEFPLLALALPPAPADAEATIALNRVGQAGGQVDRRSMAIAQDALARSPLLATPFVIAGLAASARDDDARARRLFAEVRRRDPRSVIARYWLLDDSLRRGDYAAGIAEAGPIVRLQPAAGIAVATVLTALVDVPAARPALAAALQGAPPWRSFFVQQVQATPRLTAAAAPLFGTDERSRTALLDALIRSGHIDRAHALWLASVPAGTPAGLYDGRFLGLPGSPPFNWRLSGERSGIVERRPGGGVSIRAPDDHPRPLAEQVIVLTPDAYRLSFKLSTSDEEVADGALLATVRCAADGRTLARGEFAPSGDHAPSLKIGIPVNCHAILLQFAVAPGMTPGPFAATLDNVELTDGI